MEKWCFRNTNVMVSEIKDNSLKLLRGGMGFFPFFFSSCFLKRSIFCLFVLLTHYYFLKYSVLIFVSNKVVDSMLAECLNLFMFRNWINSTEFRRQKELKLWLFFTLINFWVTWFFLLFFFNNFMLTLKIKPRQQRQYIYICGVSRINLNTSEGGETLLSISEYTSLFWIFGGYKILYDSLN